MFGKTSDLGRGFAVAVMVLAVASSPVRAQNAAYHVGVDDVLRILVWSQANLSGPFTVGASGDVTFPLIGNVRVLGLTVDQIEEELHKRLADGYLVDPQVTVEVAEYRSQRVFVVGEVRTPGSLALTGTLTLVEALTRVGSFTEHAGGELVVIRPPAGRPSAGPVLPTDPGAAKVLRLDVATLQARGPTANIALQDGDTVLVPRAELVSVVGQVRNPGNFPLTRDMTVYDVITQAGGLTDLGSNRRLKVIRTVSGQRREIKAKLDDKVQVGDTVVVPMRLF